MQKKPKTYDTLFHQLAEITEIDILYARDRDPKFAARAATLIVNGCSHNLLNDKGKTPLQLLEPYKEFFVQFYAVLKAGDVKCNAEETGQINKIESLKDIQNILQSEAYNNDQLKTALQTLLFHYPSEEEDDYLKEVNITTFTTAHQPKKKYLKHKRCTLF